MDKEQLEVLEELANSVDRLAVIEGGAVEAIRGHLDRFAEAVEKLVEDSKAKDAHLLDMRKLVFESDWIELQRGEPIRVVEDK